LRLILLLGEFSQVTPPGMDATVWRGELKELADSLTACCREVDPTSTEYMLAHAADQDILVGEPLAGASAIVSPAAAPAPATVTSETTEAVPPDESPAIGEPLLDDFGSGIVESE
jgi:hypothetical protein